MDQTNEMIRILHDIVLPKKRTSPSHKNSILPTNLNTCVFRFIAKVDFFFDRIVPIHSAEPKHVSWHDRPGQNPNIPGIVRDLHPWNDSNTRPCRTYLSRLGHGILDFDIVFEMLH